MLASVKQQFLKFWQGQNNQRRIMLIAAVAAVAILIPVFLSWANTPTYAVAFSGLSEEDAAQIVQKMDEAGISYQLKDTSTILVPSNQVYSVRLQMAQNGLPTSGTVGYELFSGNTLGMTEFTQKVNYQRALEGELERTIGSISSVAAVRVHIVTPEKTLLADTQDPTTASVTIQEKLGQKLTQSQVQAITHLVASSVEGLKPENVVVIDSNGNMLASGSAVDESEAAQNQTDAQREAEMAAAAEVQKKVQSLLDSVLGPNKSVVQASVNMDWTSRKTTTESYKPDPTAVRSSQKTDETYTTGAGVAGGIPGAGSNIPTVVPTLTATGTPGNLIYHRSEETINYEMSKTQIDAIENPGQVKRISLSVMVDGITDQTQLDALKSAVSAAAGIDAARGDTVAVETLAFDRTYYDTQASEMKKSEQTDQYIKIAEGVALVLVLAGILFYLSRLFKNLRMSSSDAWMPILKPVSEMALPGGSSMAFGQMAASLPMGEESAMPPEPAPVETPINKVELPPKMNVNVQSPEDEQMSKVISRLAEENPANVAEIIQLWLSEDEK